MDFKIRVQNNEAICEVIPVIIIIEQDERCKELTCSSNNKCKYAGHATWLFYHLLLLLKPDKKI